MADEYMTWDDDVCLGKVAPSTELGDFIEYPSMDQQRIDLHPGKVNVVYFMCKFEKGAYNCNDEMSDLYNKYKDDVQVLALSTDPDRATVEKFLTKCRKGEVMNLTTNVPHRLDMPVGWDDGKKTFGMYRALCGGKLTTYHAFIVDRQGKIAWHQQFAQTCPPSKVKFEEQLKHVLAGEPLDLNGPKTQKAPEEIEEEDAECDDMA
eukprot:Rhum_TRINITY_DN6762_c0_g1::Rhum_TRINITY_DN6762_c0_g1_i1::g.20741::m.20741